MARKELKIKTYRHVSLQKDKRQNVILVQIDESDGRHQTACVFGKMICDGLFTLQFVDTADSHDLCSHLR